MQTWNPAEHVPTFVMLYFNMAMKAKFQGVSGTSHAFRKALGLLTGPPTHVCCISPCTALKAESPRTEGAFAGREAAIEMPPGSLEKVCAFISKPRAGAADGEFIHETLKLCLQRTRRTCRRFFCSFLFVGKFCRQINLSNFR